MPKPFLTWIAEPSATHPPGTYPYNKTALSSQEYLLGVHSCYHLCVHCREHSPQLPGLSLTRWTWGSLTTSHQALHVLNCQQRTQKIKSLLSSRSSSLMASVSFPVSQSFQEFHTSTPSIKFNWNYPEDQTCEEGWKPVLKDFIIEMMILKYIIYHQYPDDTNCNLTKHS